MKEEKSTHPLDVAFRWVHHAEAVVLAAGVLLVAAATIVNVVGRSLFGESLAALEEICSLSMVWITFVGAGYAAGQGRHIRMTALFDQLPDGARRWAMVVLSGLTSLLMAGLAFWAFDYIGTVRTLGTVTPALELPIWLAYIAAPVGLALAAVQFGLTALRNLMSDTVWLSWSVAEEPADPESVPPTTPGI